MSRLLEAFKDFSQARTAIADLKYHMDKAKEVMADTLKGSLFKRNVKELIDKKLYEGMTDDYKKRLDEVRENRKKEDERNRSIASWASIDDEGNYSHGNISYSTCGYVVFDPEKDEYEITDIHTVTDPETHEEKISIEVDCVKCRQHLGITGCWIPSIFHTEYFSVKELEKAEELDM